MLPALTATGSALALRTESFRRFLQASEGRHVEWAWKQGLLREYSAWAVALGAAQAWERALKGSSVPPTETTHGPLLVYYAASSFSQHHHRPELERWARRRLRRRVLGRQRGWWWRRRELRFVVTTGPEPTTPQR